MSEAPTTGRRLADLVAARFAMAPPVAAPSVGPTTPPDSPTAANSPTAVTPDTSAIERMLDHRICRRFTDHPVEDDLLDVVLATTFSTPSKSDFQQCSVIVIDDAKRRHAIADLIPSMPWVIECPRFLVFCGDSHRIRQVADSHGVVFANDHLDAFLNAASDASMHLSTFIWAAESVGLGTCPISVVRNHIDEVSEILELPDHVFPLAGMCLGWPQRPGPLSPRLPMSITVHHDRYDDRHADTLIADYDQRRHDARPKDDLWSTTKAAMVGRSERSQLARFLRSKRFCLD